MNLHFLAAASLMLIGASDVVAAEEPNLRGVITNSFKEQVAEALDTSRCENLSPHCADCYCDYEDEDEAASFLSYCNRNACPPNCKSWFDCEDGGGGGGGYGGYGGGRGGGGHGGGYGGYGGGGGGAYCVNIRNAAQCKQAGCNWIGMANQCVPGYEGE